MSEAVVEVDAEPMEPREWILLGEGHRLLPNTANAANAIVVMAKQGQGICYGFTVYNSSASSQWIHLLTPDTFQVSGSTPIMAYPLPGKSLLAVDFGQHGRPFRQGFALSNSTTDTTLTPGSANCFFDVQYV